MRNALRATTLLLPIALAWRRRARRRRMARKAVLVTGASSGIGRKITERLASNGFFVYAGARAQKDLDDSERHSERAGDSAGRHRREPTSPPPSPRSRRRAADCTASSTTPAWSSSRR